MLNNFLGEYNTMAKRGMDLVLFMAAAQHVSQVVWSLAEKGWSSMENCVTSQNDGRVRERSDKQ